METELTEKKICEEIIEVIKNEREVKEGLWSDSKKSYSTVYFFDKLAFKIKCGKKKSYIALKNTFEYILPDYSFLKTEQTKFDKWIRIIFESIVDVENLHPLFLRIYDEMVAEPFGCCSRYTECSDSMKCIHPDHAHAMGCKYRKNLLNGKIFYGKNKNI